MWRNQNYHCIVIVFSTLFVIVIVCHPSNTKIFDLELCWSVPGPTQRSCDYHCIFIFFLPNVIITSYLLTILFHLSELSHLYNVSPTRPHQELIVNMITFWLLYNIITIDFCLLILPGQQYKRFFRLETRTLLIISPTIPTQNDISPTGTEKL